MIVPVMAISNLVLTQQIYSEETKGAHAHNRDRVPLNFCNISSCMEFLGIHIHKMNIAVKPPSLTTSLVYDHLQHLTISSCISVKILSTQEVKRAQKRV